MATKKLQESKTAKLDKATRSNKEKKKWVSKKESDGIRKLVFVDTTLIEKLKKDVSNMKILTKSSISDKYNLNWGVCQRIFNMLEEEKLITKVKTIGKMKLYTGGKMIKKEEEEIVQTENVVDDEVGGF